MRVLIGEDNLRTQKLLRSHLIDTGFAVDLASTEREFRDMVASYSYDLYLIDAQLPDGTGTKLLRDLRREVSSAPIIMLSDPTTIALKVESFESGADDFLLKPYHFDELLARMRALLRRSMGLTALDKKVGRLVLDIGSQEVFCNGRRIELKPAQSRLLVLMMQRSGQLVLRSAIENTLQCTAHHEASPNAVDQAISRLRRSLPPHATGVCLKTVKGAGYVLQELPGAQRLSA